MANTDQVITPPEDNIQDLIALLGNLFWSPVPPGPEAQLAQGLRALVAGNLSDGDVEDLVDTFGQLAKHSFTPEQRALLAEGMRALPDAENNRNDPVRLKSAIDLFRDNLQTVFDHQLDVNQKRLLTRALVRLVREPLQTPPASDEAALSIGTPRAAG